MALFDTVSEQDKVPMKKLDRIISEVNNTYRLYYSQSKNKHFLLYLESVKKNPSLTIIRPFQLYVDVVEAITYNRTDYNINTYLTGVQKAEELYPKIFPYGHNTPDFAVLAHIFINFFKPNGVSSANLFDATLMSTFKNKHNYVEFMNTIADHKKSLERLPDIVQYGLRVRAFFVDDETYTANMKQVAQKLLKGGNLAEIIISEAKKVEHMAGIYDIDEADVAKTEEQLIKANALLNNTMDILEQADRKTQQFNRIMQDTTNTIQEISKRETDLITMKAISAKEELNATYNSFLEEQKQEILLQKDVLIRQLFQEAESKLKELKNMARTLTATANSDLVRINTETSNALDKINNYISNDKELKELLSKADTYQELYDKISKLEILNNQNIDMITREMEAKLNTANQEANIVVPTTPTVVPSQAVVPSHTIVSSQAAVPSQVVVQEAIVTDKPGSDSSATVAPPVVLTSDTATTIISEVNPFLDTRIPFQDRYQLVMKEKEKRIANGEHFHAMFDDILTVLMEDANPYMIGPSGCGKTFMVQQIASLLHLDFTDIGYINEEYDILGFQTATGDYSATNFYRCYKYGKIAFCDELDNGNSRATVKLNSFLSNGKDAQYSFPNGENVRRHQNFRIIAAGNTAGNGADANYNTREKIEESVQQRFTPIYVGYDNTVERYILKNYNDWYSFVVLFRKATDAWGNQNDCAAPGIFTTRDAARIKRYLDNKSLDMSRILDYEFIQTKDLEYLAFLSKHMGERLTYNPQAKAIYQAFQTKVKNLRENGGFRL